MFFFLRKKMMLASKKAVREVQGSLFFFLSLVIKYFVPVHVSFS